MKLDQQIARYGVVDYIVQEVPYMRLSEHPNLPLILTLGGTC